MLLSEKRNIKDEKLDLANYFNNTNWIIFFISHLIVAVTALIVTDLQIFKSKFLFFVFPIILIFIAYLTFKKIYNWRGKSLLKKLSKEKQEIFLERRTPYKIYSKNYIWTNLLVIFLVFGLFYKLVKNDTLSTGTIIEYGKVTNLRKSPNHIYYVHFDYILNGVKKSDFSKVIYFSGEYRNNYGFPIRIGDEYAVMVNKTRNLSAEMNFKIPSPNQISIIRESLICKDASKENVIDSIFKRYNYLGLMAYYYSINPELIKKIDLEINSESRKQIHKIRYDDLFVVYLSQK